MRLKLALIFALITTANATGIPLPSQSIAQNKGMVAGMGLGTLKYAGCQTLWTWTAQATYSYNSFISSGPKIKFLGGNIDSKNNIVNQKYIAFANFMHNKPDHALFIGPIASFEIIDKVALRGEGSSNQCGDLFGKSDFSTGYQSGAGFLITKDWGLNFGHSMDITLNGVFTLAFSAAIAFNLREYVEKFAANTKNFWVFFEYSPTLIKINISNVSHHVILGGAVGF